MNFSSYLLFFLRFKYIKGKGRRGLHSVPSMTADINKNINSTITKDVIVKGIQNLKKNRAFGDDQIMNK